MHPLTSLSFQEEHSVFYSFSCILEEFCYLLKYGLCYSIAQFFIVVSASGQHNPNCPLELMSKVLCWFRVLQICRKTHLQYLVSRRS